MDTKNIIALLFMFVLATSFISLVLAEENETNVTTTADEPMLISSLEDNTSLDEQAPSAFRQGWETFKLNFVRNQTLKAERELQLAKWKLLEAKNALKNGNMNRAEKAMEAHDAILVKFQERIAKMENKSLTPGLDNALEVHAQRLSDLNMLLEKANLSETQKENIAARISKIENTTSDLEETRSRIEQRMQERIENLENRSQGVEERGDEVQERIQKRINARNNSDDDFAEIEEENSSD